MLNEGEVFGLNSNNSDYIDIRNWLLSTKSKEFQTQIDIFNKYSRGFLRERHDTGESGSTIDRFAEKWDTSGDAISSQASANFSKALLPLGIDSVYVSFAEGKEALKSLPNSAAKEQAMALISQVEEKITLLLRKRLKESGLMEHIVPTVRDYLDYGNCVLLLTLDVKAIKVEALDFNKTYFWQGGKESGWGGRYLVLHRDQEYDFILSARFPEYRGSTRVSSVKKTLDTIYFSDGRKVCLIGDQVVSNEELLVQSLFIGTINKSSREYGFGDGLTSLGALLMANFCVSSEYLTMQKFNNPPVMVLDGVGVELEGDSVYSAISQSPGDVNRIRSASNTASTLNIDQMIKFLAPPIQHLSAFIEIQKEAEKSVSDQYKAGLMNMHGEIPNETARAAAARISQTMRDYQSRSEVFTKKVLDPALELVMLSSQEILQLIFGLKEIITLIEPGLPQPKVRSFADEGEEQLKILKLHQEMEMRAMLAQMPPEIAGPLLLKMEKLFGDD